LAVPLFALRGRPLRFALALGAVLLACPPAIAQRSSLQHEERSFFGVLRVVRSDDGRFRYLIHGTTLHGAQRAMPTVCDVPLGYYHPMGPAGDLFRELPARV